MAVRKPMAAAKPAAGMATPATAKPAASKPLTFDVLPHEGELSERWDLHQKGARKHEYYRTQKEAIDAAWTLAAGRPAHVVLHARDGHTYREFDKP